jgi:hypothetical protein
MALPTNEQPPRSMTYDNMSESRALSRRSRPRDLSDSRHKERYVHYFGNVRRARGAMPPGSG